jgi:two-component system cell cycle sensor histidine kinase/response regulator CckA
MVEIDHNNGHRGPPALSPAPDGPTSVLLVDESAADAARLTRLLRETARDDFHIVHVASVEAAISHLATNEVQLVTADLSRPFNGNGNGNGNGHGDGNGVAELDGVQRLLEAARDIPLVVLTGNDHALGERALSLGAEDFLVHADISGPRFARSLINARQRRVQRNGHHVAEQLLMVGRLAAGVAHEINNLLAAISGTAEVLVGEAASPECNAMIRDILAQVERGRGVTRHLLTLGRRDRYEPHYVDPNVVLETVATTVERWRTPDLRVERQFDRDAPLVHVDQAQLEQALMQLARNAIEAMPNGGTISFTCRRAAREQDRAPTNGGAPRDGLVVLAVSDTGDGVPEALRDRIFTPFFSTKHDETGTGLGLSTVRDIAIRNGGEARLSTRSRQGATFELLLPSHRTDAAVAGISTDGAVPAAAPPVTAVREPAPVQRTILLVEDDAAVLRIMTRLLQRAGYRVIAALSADDAWGRWEALGDRIDLLLTDLIVPGELHPLEMAARIRATRPDFPVVFCSGYAASFSSADVQFIEGENFVQKPFAFSTLIDTVARHLPLLPAVTH